MVNSEYRFKFYLNARHEMEIDNKVNNVHPHTWEFNLFFRKVSDEFVQFSTVEKELQFFLSMYEGQLINEIPPFDLIEPSLENIGTVLYKQIKRIMLANKWTLLRLEISENPSRTYIIYDDDPENLIDSIENKNKYGYLSRVKKENNKPEYKENEEDKIVLKNNNDELAVTIEEACSINNTDIKISSKIHKQNDHISIKEILVSLKRLFLSSLFRNIVVIFLASILLISFITSKGNYPWGSDTWGHLFKSHLLYKEAMKGNLYPVYTDLWYNGVQPFRYWAPLPYYILMFFEVITKGNTLLSYNLFIIFTFIFGALGWVLLGKKTGRNNFALLLALLWFFMPDNARVLFAEGNIPRVLVTNIFPYLLFFLWDYVERRRKKSIVMISVCMFLITLSHAMISAMVAITITLFIVIYGSYAKKLKVSLEAILSVAIGIGVSGFWLYPALKGGIVSMDSDAASEVMKGLTYPLLQTLNPYMRFSNPEIYYFGLSVFLIALIGVIFGSKKSKAGFLVCLLILAGTTTALLFLFKKIPMSQLFWMMRFTPLAYGVFFMGLLLWEKRRRVVTFIIALILTADCWVSVKTLCFDVPKPNNLINAVEPTVNSVVQRVAMLDSSEFGSFPSDFLAFNGSSKVVSQVYGWAWQGAKTANNIVWINTALEKGWYTFMFDRCLELGADTLVVKKDKVSDKNDFFTKASIEGYTLVDESPLSYTFKYPVNSQFGTKVTYTGIAIGNYASNLSYIFPNFQVGESEYLDFYTIDQLEKYKVLFLSGFKYNDRLKAEGMVKELSEKGIKVLIDMTGTESDINSSRPEFLNVIAEPVLVRSSFPVLEYENDRINLSELPEDYKNWNTIYLENLDNVVGQIEFNNQFMSFLGSKINKNITFIGLNLPYYALVTKDRAAITMFENITGMKSQEKPEREIVKVNIKSEGDKIDISSAKEGTSIGIAYLDSFNVKKGKLTEVHNIIKLEGTSAEIKVITPYVKKGMLISVMGIIALIIFLRFKQVTLRKGGR